MIRRQPRIPLEELCRLPSFFFPLVSWKGDQVAFYWDKSGRMELHVMDLATKALRQISHGEVPRAMRTGFAWSRDDRFIAFGKDAAGNEQHDLYKIEVETGNVTQLTNDPAAEEHAVQFSPDDEWLAVVTNKRLPESPDRPGQINIWKIHADGSDYTPLTRHAFPAFGGLWSDDGTWISYVTNEDLANLKNRDGYIVRPDGTGARKIFSVRAGSQDTLGDWHPDSRHIAATSDASGQNRAGTVDIETGEVRWYSPDGIEAHALRFSKSGKWLVTIRNEESQVRPILYEVDSGTARELKLPAGFALGAQFFANDTKLLINYSTDVTRSALVAYDLATGTAEALLEPEYGSIDRKVFVNAEHIWYETFDGRQIPALLYRPRDIAPGEKLPALVHVHGGPTGQWFRGFDPFAQFLVDRGLVVLEPNIRGSTGYGVDFRDAALKDWGGADLEDVAAGADFLKALPYVDRERLVVFGGSYGGGRMHARRPQKKGAHAAPGALVGITHAPNMCDRTKEHYRYFLREQMGDPREDHDLWRDRSAVEFADQLTAKLLLVHGVNDPRCPVSQSRIFRDMLLTLGKREGEDFEYVELADEGHGSADIQQKIRTFTILADYLERVL